MKHGDITRDAKRNAYAHHFTKSMHKCLPESKQWTYHQACRLENTYTLSVNSIQIHKCFGQIEAMDEYPWGIKDEFSH